MEITFNISLKPVQTQWPDCSLEAQTHSYKWLLTPLEQQSPSPSKCPSSSREHSGMAEAFSFNVAAAATRGPNAFESVTQGTPVVVDKQGINFAATLLTADSRSDIKERDVPPDLTPTDPDFEPPLKILKMEAVADDAEANFLDVPVVSINQGYAMKSPKESPQVSEEPSVKQSDVALEQQSIVEELELTESEEIASQIILPESTEPPSGSHSTTIVRVAVPHVAHIADIERWQESYEQLRSQSAMCPLCDSASLTESHFQMVHVRHAVHDKDANLSVAVCLLSGCRGVGVRQYGHYHCYCGECIPRKAYFLRHLCKHWHRLMQQEGGQHLYIEEKVHKLEVVLGSCPLCHEELRISSLKRHLLKKHGASMSAGVGQLPAVAVDPDEGIYMVARSNRGTQKPVHVKFCTKRGNSNVFCESPKCIKASESGQRKGEVIWPCPHMTAFTNAVHLPDQQPLSREVLKSLYGSGVITREKAEEVSCAVDELTSVAQGPVALYWRPNSFTSNQVFVSVYEPQVRPYAKLHRVVVTLNASTLHISCPCSWKPAPKSLDCLHRYIALWRIVQESPEFLSKFSAHLLAQPSEFVLEEVTVQEHCESL